MKLHIGCGNNYLDGWVNLDIDTSLKCDVYEDATQLKSIKDSSCDVIYACHILEHLSRHEYLSVLEVWHKKLKPHGSLRISVPDFGKVVEKYTVTQELNELLGFLVGGQKDEYDLHKMVFDEKKLTTDLMQVGFTKVEKWDWRKVDHGKYDDYSQAYLPHMDKNDGKLMSLNLEARK